MNDNCIFCMIVGGQIGASTIYEDANVLAFLDIRPVTNGHALVIPKRHAAYLAELDQSDGGRLFQVINRSSHRRSCGAPVDAPGRPAPTLKTLPAMGLLVASASADAAPCENSCTLPCSSP